MLKERMTIRIFDPLGEHHHDKLKRVGEIDADTDKMDLKKDYKTPAPLGQDLFRECGQLTDYQWTLLSGVVKQRLQECHRASSMNALNLENIAKEWLCPYILMPRTKDRHRSTS